EPGKRDLIVDPTNLWLTIHESIGHSTELDRALGYEANFAGTSFATPDKLNKLRIGAPHLTFYADKTTPGGLATCGYDDDGVRSEPGKRDLIVDPTNLWLTIHESIGHSTELDRALGYEANFAGTSFATPDKLNKLRIGAPHLTFYADKTTPGGLATCGYDDDGV